MHRKIALVAALAFLVVATAWSQAPAASGPSRSPSMQRLEEGIALFGAEKYREAVEAFGLLLMDRDSSALHPDALYWSALAYMAVGDSANAERMVDTFLGAFPRDQRVPDVLYQQGRLLFQKKEFQKAIQVFQAFVEAAPAHELYSSALFWTAESLFSLGQLEKAEIIFQAIVEKYPKSVKFEAASYRLSIIGLSYREKELLTLLKWSHEESLKIIEEFQRREKTYEQAISLYQRRIAESRSGAVMSEKDMEAKIAELEAAKAQAEKKAADQERELASLRAQVTALLAQIASLQRGQPVAAAPVASSTPAQADTRNATLALKEEALGLVEFYLSWLAANATQGKGQ